LNLAGLGFKGSQSSIHFVDPLFAPIQKKVNAVWRGHFLLLGTHVD